MKKPPETNNTIKAATKAGRTNARTGKGSGHGRKPPVQYRKEPDPLSHVMMMRYIDAHCEWLLITNYSINTARSRRQWLRVFASWAYERGIEDPSQVTKPILERYQRHLYYYRKEDGSALVAGSQANLLSSVKTFFKWATRHNHILYNPASELDIPRQQKRLPRNILTVEEVAAILNEASPSNLYGLRDRAMLELLYSTGLRRMEIAKLTRSDIDFNRNVVFVREGKGGKDRVVPMGARAAAWLEKYLYEARPELSTIDTASLFVTDYGDPMNGHFVAQRVKRYMALAGVERTGAAHLLRHACATHMLEGGADIRFIQALLGHASLETTEIYTQVSIEKLRAIHDATHPGAQTGARRAQSQTDEAKPQPESENTPQALLDALDAEAQADGEGSEA